MQQLCRNLDARFAECLVNCKVKVADGAQAAVDVIKVHTQFKVQRTVAKAAEQNQWLWGCAVFYHQFIFLGYLCQYISDLFGIAAVCNTNPDDGAAANVANMLRGLDVEVTMAGAVGDDAQRVPSPKCARIMSAL